MQDYEPCCSRPWFAVSHVWGTASSMIIEQGMAVLHQPALGWHRLVHNKQAQHILSTCISLPLANRNSGLSAQDKTGKPWEGPHRLQQPTSAQSLWHVTWLMPNARLLPVQTAGPRCLVDNINTFKELKFAVCSCYCCHCCFFYLFSSSLCAFICCA